MNDDLYDVAIVGAGPAGATAAALLAQSGHRTLLVDRASGSRGGASAGWLNARAAPLLARMGVPVAPLLDCAFKDVTFFNADFSKTAKPSFDAVPGYLIDRPRFKDALVATAVACGATLLDDWDVADVALLETRVVIGTCDGRHRAARLLVVSTGRGRALVDQLGQLEEARPGIMWSGQVDVATSGDAGSVEPHVAVVLGMDRSGSFGVCTVSGDWASAAINWLGDPASAVDAMTAMCDGLAARGVVPAALVAATPRVKIERSPASVALDMDSHVGKHTLIIGDAGGFVSAASNEGIYPAMWSAQLASEVVSSALAGTCSQDELMAFDTKWRIAMADYLRSPNTDIQFLLPLIFSNQPMADRMGAAFFSGENI